MITDDIRLPSLRSVVRGAAVFLCPPCKEYRLSLEPKQKHKHAKSSVVLSLNSYRMAFNLQPRARRTQSQNSVANKQLAEADCKIRHKMFFVIILTLATVVALFVRHIYTFWQRKGFPVDGPKIPFGSLHSVVRRQRSFGMAMHDVYMKTTGKLVGIYLVHRPALLIRDAELAHNMLVQDFASFHDRGVYVDEENDPYSGNLFALPGERWRTLRNKLAPSFTSGKLKGMFASIDDVGNKMLEHLKNIVPNEGGAMVEMKHLFSTYAIDIIGSTILGLEINSFTNPQNEFQVIRKEINNPSFMNVVRVTAVFLCPSLEKLFVRLGVRDKVADLMKSLVRRTVEFREKNNFVRKDLMQMLIQLRNTGRVNLDDSIWDAQSSADGFKSMSIENMAGQAFLFYVAGFDTSASAAAFTIYELAQNPELLAKAQQDIDEALKKHDGKITYESIKDMKYLDLCFMETIRKYPGLPILNRECTKDYPVPGTDKVIEKGTPIVIPLFSIHRDEEHFPDPMKYDPERFTEETKNYNPVAYMPFGEGPRHCIAQRMGKINVKVAVAKVLTHYDIHAVKKAEIEIDNYSVPIVPKGGVNLRLTKKLEVLSN